MTDINSKSYWDERFTGDWQDKGGGEQTTFFYNVASGLFPQWFKNAVEKEKFSICDWGCATGEGTNILQNILGTPVVGNDFSSVAIEIARTRYPDINFHNKNYIAGEKGAAKFDIFFSSNTLEHFSEPWKTAEQLSKYAKECMVFLLPFEEENVHSEHFTTFTEQTIPQTVGNKFQLSYVRTILTSSLPNTKWEGKQILLIFGTNKFVKKHCDESFDGRFIYDVVASEIELLKAKLATARDSHERLRDKVSRQIQSGKTLSLEKEKVLEQLNKSNEARTAERRARKTQSKELDQVLAQLNKSKKERAAERRTHKAQSKELDQVLAQLNKSKKERAAERRTHKAQSKELDQVLAQLNKSKKERAAEQRTHKAQSKKNNQVRDAFHRESEKNQELQKRLVGAMRTARAMTIERDEMAIERDNLWHELIASQASMKQAGAEIANLEPRVNILKMQLAAVDQKRNNLEFSVHAFENSTSWKVTKPLRVGSESVRLLSDGSGNNGRRFAHMKYLLQTFGLKHGVQKVIQRLGGDAADDARNSAVLFNSPQIFTNSADINATYQEGSRIGLYLPSLNVIGGMEIWVRDIAFDLMQQGCAVSMLVFDAPPTTESGQEFESNLPFRPVYLHEDASLLAGKIQELQLDSVLLHNIYEGLAGLDARVKIIEVIHNIYYWQRDDRDIAEARKHIDFYVAVSEHAKDYAVTMLDFPASKTVVIPHALNSRGFYRPYRSFLEKRGKSETFQILCAANQYYQKNLICLIEAFARFEDQNAILTISGGFSDVEYGEEIEAVVSRLNLHKRVVRVGMQSRRALSQLYAKANMFVFPSLYEGFGLAALEATYFGLPVVVSNTGNDVGFLNADKSNGIVCDIAADKTSLSPEHVCKLTLNPSEQSVASLAEAMNQLHRDYAQYLKASLDYMEQVSAYTSSEVARRYLEISSSLSTGQMTKVAIGD